MRRTPKQPTLRTAVDREGNSNCLPVTKNVNWDHSRYHPNFRGCAIRTFRNSIKKVMCKLHTWTHKNPCETTMSSHPWPSSPKTLLQSKLQLIWCQDQSWHQAAIKIHKGTTREQQLATPSDFRKPSDPTSPSRGWPLAHSSRWLERPQGGREYLRNGLSALAGKNGEQMTLVWVILKVSRV